MLAYLPDILADWIETTAGTDPHMILFLLVVLFVIVGGFVDAVPALIIFMPINIRLVELGGISPVHIGRANREFKNQRADYNNYASFHDSFHRRSSVLLPSGQ
jgi:hypothetical protein